jgi:hypothetical protein
MWREISVFHNEIRYRMWKFSAQLNPYIPLHFLVLQCSGSCTGAEAEICCVQAVGILWCLERKPVNMDWGKIIRIDAYTFLCYLCLYDVYCDKTLWKASSRFVSCSHKACVLCLVSRLQLVLVFKKRRKNASSTLYFSMLFAYLCIINCTHFAFSLSWDVWFYKTISTSHIVTLYIRLFVLKKVCQRHCVLYIQAQTYPKIAPQNIVRKVSFDGKCALLVGPHHLYDWGGL